MLENAARRKENHLKTQGKLQTKTIFPEKPREPRAGTLFFDRLWSQSVVPWSDTTQGLWGTLQLTFAYKGAFFTENQGFSFPRLLGKNLQKREK